MTVIVDEAGMLNTSDLARLVTHAEQRQWRLVLVGDPHQLQAVGRGGMFLELCDTGRYVELEHLHRFANPWEAAASLELRRGNLSVIDTYAAHGRIRAGTFDEHLDTIADLWQHSQVTGESLSIITTRTEHVNAINDHIQQRRVAAGVLDPDTLTPAADSWVMVGDVVATRRNERRLRTNGGDQRPQREELCIAKLRAGRERHRLPSSTPTERHPTGTVTSMVRTLDLAQWAGRWVAIDEYDRVQRDARSLKDLMEILDAEGVEGLSIMRAPAPGEPVVYGLG